MKSDCEKINGYKTSLVIILIISVLLSGFCTVWTFKKLNNRETELNDIIDNIKGYHPSTYRNDVTDEDDKTSTKTASEMFIDLMQIHKSEINTLEEQIHDLFVFSGRTDTHLSSAQKIQVIKEILSRQRKKTQTLETEKRKQERRIPIPQQRETSTKKILKSPNHLHVRCNVKNNSSTNAGEANVEFVFQEQIEYEYDAKSQRVSCFYYNARPLQFFVAKEYIKDGYVNTKTDPLQVRTSMKKDEHNVFLKLPSGARVQQITNREVEDGWMEIRIPTEDIFFIIEQ